MKIMRFQAGGEMPAAPEQGGAAPAEQGGGGDPMEQIIPAMAQAVQAGDCQALMQICNDFLQLISGAAGGGAPQQGGGQPAFARRGGRLVRV